MSKMTRWRRIALVRKLSSEQAASAPGGELAKFARGQRVPGSQLAQQVREKCQEIWDRQAASLSSDVILEDVEEDGEGEEDLDSFAGDLENLLEEDAQEEARGESRSKLKEAMRGSGSASGRQRALEAQRAEELEDEEAEAAELRRMLMEGE